MNELEVATAGLMVTIQDTGRFGHAHSGISSSGPMDPLACRTANALVGNSAGQAALEFAYLGGSYRVESPCRVAVTGAVPQIRIDGRPVAAWESHPLKPGELLEVGAINGGVWGYIAFSGGIAVPPVLGSRATHLRTGLGGLDGSVLCEGARLPLGDTQDGPLLRLTLPIRPKQGGIHVVPGPQDDYFSSAVWEHFLSSPFQVSTKRDRMACVLEGPHLAAFRGHDIISDGVVPGAIQVPSSGQPIVLGADCQTTGGYPKIAVVTSFDLARLHQLPSGSSFRFVSVTQQRAEEMARGQASLFKRAIEDLRQVP